MVEHAPTPTRRVTRSESEKENRGVIGARVMSPVQRRRENGRGHEQSMSSKSGENHGTQSGTNAIAHTPLKMEKSRIPKKVDVHLPGPEPKISDPSSESTSTEGKMAPAKIPRHSRTSSAGSVSTESTREKETSSTTSSGPPSSYKRDLSKSSKRRLQTPDDGSDASSAAESAKGLRKRKFEIDRVHFFKNDPRCADVEPFRVLCKDCKEWVALHDKRKYVMQNWIAHKKACPNKSNNSAEASTAEGTSEDTQMTPATADTQSAEMDSSAQIGKAALENDSRTGEIRPHEVFCTSCGDWVSLDPEVPYSTANWDEHLCGFVIVNNSPTGFPQHTSGTDVPQPSSRKRAREDDEDPVPEVGRSVRARTEEYRPAKGRGLWKMMLKPIHSFVQGFKEGMKS